MCGYIKQYLGNCNTLNDLSYKVCVLNKTEDIKYTCFQCDYNNESRILTKHVSCEFKCKFDDRKSNSNQKWNNDKC